MQMHCCKFLEKILWYDNSFNKHLKIFTRNIENVGTLVVLL